MLNHIHGLVNFRWWVPANGFEWIEGSNLFAKPVEITPNGITSTAELSGSYYRPLETETSLFVVFAETATTETGILDFANRYGSLTSIAGLPSPGVPSKGSSRLQTFFGKGESISTWKDEIAEMKKTVSLWKAVENNPLEDLRKLIRWSESDRGDIDVSYISKPASKQRKRGGPVSPEDCCPIASSHLDHEVIRTFDRDDPKSILNYYLSRLINDRLLGFSDHSSFSGCVRYEMVWDPVEKKANFQIRPETLLAAMWLQFARAVDRANEFRSCTVCKKLFEVGLQINRRTRLHCSDACKIAAYRQRQVDARKMYAAGKTFEIIAEELDTKVEKVRKWVTGE